MSLPITITWHHGHKPDETLASTNDLWAKLKGLKLRHYHEPRRTGSDRRRRCVQGRRILIHQTDHHDRLICTISCSQGQHVSDILDVLDNYSTLSQELPSRF